MLVALLNGQGFCDARFVGAASHAIVREVEAGVPELRPCDAKTMVVRIYEDRAEPGYQGIDRTRNGTYEPSVWLTRYQEEQMKWKPAAEGFRIEGRWYWRFSRLRDVESVPADQSWPASWIVGKQRCVLVDLVGEWYGDVVLPIAFVRCPEALVDQVHSERIGRMVKKTLGIVSGTIHVRDVPLFLRDGGFQAFFRYLREPVSVEIVKRSLAPGRYLRIEVADLR